MDVPTFQDATLVSLMPGITHQPVLVAAEEQIRDGGRRGRSPVDVPGVGKLDLAHYATPIAAMHWRLVAEQHLHVWARLGDVVVAFADFVHRADENALLAENLQHPRVWTGRSVRTHDVRQWGKGIGRTLYGYLKAFAYSLTPSDTPIANKYGENIWDKLDPEFPKNAKPCAPHFDDPDALRQFFEIFGPNPGGTRVQRFEIRDRGWPFADWQAHRGT